MLALAAAGALVAGSCGSAADTPAATAEDPGEPSRPLPTTAPSSGTVASAPAPATTAASSAAVTASTPNEIVVDRDIPYYVTGEGRGLTMDVYHPADGEDLPVVLVFHGNPVLGQTKESVQRLARAVAEQGAVVFAPTWGSPMAMNMDRVAEALLVWNSEHAPCAAWTALDLANSYRGDPGRLIVVGVVTGYMPGQAITFGTPPVDIPGCGSRSVPISVERAILFEGDWLLVPNIWDDVVRADAGFLGSFSYWDALAGPSHTQVRMLFGEHEAPDTVRSLGGMAYEESEWIGIRDPEGSFGGDFAELGVLDDGEMSFADVTRVITARMITVGWDAQIVIVPGAGHSLGSSNAIDFVADLVLGDP